MTIDWWSLGIQAVNIAVLIWLLSRYFWRPVAAMIEQRRASVAQTLADADAKRQQAEASLAEIARSRAGFVEERDAILRAAHDAAELELRARQDEATRAVGAMEVAAKAEIAKSQDAANRMMAQHAAELAVDIAQRLLARFDHPAIRAAFLDGLLAQIRDMAATWRDALAVDGVALAVIWASPLAADEQTRAATLLASVLGGTPNITFSVDPALIAGVELHGPHFVVSNSWRADLADILAGLTQDG